MGIPILVALFVIKKGKQFDPYHLLLFVLLMVFGYFVALSDIKTKTISNSIILLMLGAWVIVMVPKLFMDTYIGVLLLKNAILGFLIGGGLFLVVYIVSKKGLGGGDVKFMAAAGLYLGLRAVFSAMFFGTCLAAITGLILILLKRIGRKDTIPLAPFLYIGILLTVFSL